MRIREYNASRSLSLVTVLAVVVAGLLIPSNCPAQNLLDKKYASLSIGQMLPGDDAVADLVDSVLQFGIDANFPMSENCNLTTSFRYSSFDFNVQGVNFSISQRGISGGFDYHSSPGESTDPFIGFRMGVALSEGDATAPGYLSESDSQTDLILALGAGADIALGDRASLRPSFEYDKVGDEDGLQAGLGLTLWISDVAFSRLGMNYGFDKGDLAYALAMGFTFGE